VPDEMNYLTLLESYLMLANVIGFSSRDMEEAYYRKNEVNYERQRKGY
jgi:dimeric dUTPase (all-alpha-NTP-PPase superfamily)